MKLYKVPNNTKIIVWLNGMPQCLLFHHIDGMYSYCENIDNHNEIVHLAAFTEVEIA